MMAITIPASFCTYRLLPLLLALMLLGTSSAAFAAGKQQKTFASPEKAVQRLIAAVKSDDLAKLVAILGPGSQPLVSSGDPVADAAGRKGFVQRYEEKNRLEPVGLDKVVLIVGPGEDPFAIPLVKKGTRWFFNTAAGREEILNRRIGKNELSAMEFARAYVVAQREYVSVARNGDGARAFAARFRSTPGAKDGLYWDVKEGEQESPLGPLAARAAQEGYGESPAIDPYHGYLFRILKAQGEHAEGGAFDYVVDGKMILGFALVAFPAQYGSSGIMTFIVNQSGVIYQKDLGEATAATAAALKLYDPDTSWKKAE